jgi:hypothetical protein
MSTGTEIERGLAFLAEQQLPAGNFDVLISEDPADVTGGESEITPFATALIVHCLGFSTSPVAHRMIARALAFLRGAMEPGGVWRYWTAEDPKRWSILPDADDTACAAQVLASNGIPVAGVRSVLLANRAPDGRFYTWITLRGRRLPRSVAFLRVALRECREPRRWRRFWTGPPSPRDIDDVVNANVVFCLGEGPGTARAIAHLAAVLQAGGDAAEDRWYPGPFVFHYMAARCFAGGVEGLAPARHAAVSRLEAAANADGSIGATVLETALAACALLSWGAGNGAVARAAGFLRAAQRADGSWPASALYLGGPGSPHAWGSDELTTAYCLEALVRCASPS